MEADPPIPADGGCAQCGGTRELPKRGRYHNAAADADPFCSTECCRAWHGVESPSPEYRGRRGYLHEYASAGASS